MSAEFEPKKFRRGESVSNAYGGHVSPEQFPQALYSLAVSRGFETQTALANALGKKRNSLVGRWYRGEGVPSPQEFGSLLVLFAPNDEELEPLAAAYGRLIQQGKGITGCCGERIFQVSQRSMRRSQTPIGRWIEGFCRKRHLTLEAFFNASGFGKRGGEYIVVSSAHYTNPHRGIQCYPRGTRDKCS